MTKNKIGSNNWWPTRDMLLGFFDADGSFNVNARIRGRGIRKKPSVSFGFLAIFSQRTLNKDVLEGIKRFFKVDYEVTNHTRTTMSGTTSDNGNLRIGLRKNDDQQLINMWSANPPLAPTKHLDFLLLKTIYDAKLFKDFGAFESLLRPQTNEVIDLTLLYLRYQNYHNRMPGKKRTAPIGTHHKTLGSSDKDIASGTKLGQEIFAKLKKQHDDIMANLTTDQLTADYLIGYIIGDGCFWTRLKFLPVNIRNRGFGAEFCFSITDATENLPLLQLVKKKLHAEIPSITTICLFRSGAGTSYKLRVVGLANNIALVNYLNSPSLPYARKNQLDCFKEILSLYPKLDENPTLIRDLIRLHWRLNPNGNQKKGSLSEDLKKGDKVIARLNQRKRQQEEND